VEFENVRFIETNSRMVIAIAWGWGRVLGGVK
jgi:hypothetical protein